MHLSDFHFDLPTELIARYPLVKRSSSRLLCVEETIKHSHFHDIIHLLNEGDLLIFNDTKVIPARIYARKTTGGLAEILVERILDAEKILAQVRVSKALKSQDKLILSDDVTFEVIDKKAQFYELQLQQKNKTILEIIEIHGHIPLPPYLKREPDTSDKERYQTIYAREKGSVAAPTAGFHFDQELLQRLHAKKIEMAYLTLHIGAGTFAPIRTQNIKEHQMHAEYLTISAELCEKVQATKAAGKRIIAVGTTTLRALETASQSGELKPYQGETTIFIYPGYHFHSADALITNLHLPSSTLLMLVCAFGGYEQIMQAYAQAVLQQYRFYSYGDAMWVPRNI